MLEENLGAAHRPVPIPQVVAIDGVLGSGKTTVARQVAQRLQLDYLDTGAMYRCVALACLWGDVPLSDATAVAEIARTVEIEVRTEISGAQQVRLNGDDVTDAIRSPEAARGAASVATIASVREAMVQQQRDWAMQRGGGVLEGRDIATVVFPNAPVKVFLTASADERAQRRQKEQPNRTLEEVRADLDWRDRQDSERKADPLRVADGATVVDTTGMSLADVVERVTDLANAGLGRTSIQHPASNPNHNKHTEQNNTGTDEKMDDEKTASSGSAQNALLKHAEEGMRPPSSFERGLWVVVRSVLTAVSRLYFRVSVEGLEHVPTTGAYLVAPTHRSILDSVVLPMITKRRIRFLGKESIFKYKPLVPLFHAMGGIRVIRGTTDRESMRICMAAMAAGEPLVAFPEGTRKEGPTIEGLFDGPAFMAVKAGVPILPIGIGGSDQAMRRHQKFPRPVKIHMVIGPPLNNPPSTSTGRSTVRTLTADLQSELQRLFDLATEKGKKKK
jgi:pantoate ligase / CMP/dCMP kinase